MYNEPHHGVLPIIGNPLPPHPPLRNSFHRMQYIFCTQWCCNIDIKYFWYHSIWKTIKKLFWQSCGKFWEIHICEFYKFTFMGQMSLRILIEYWVWEVNSHSLYLWFFLPQKIPTLNNSIRICFPGRPRRYIFCWNQIPEKPQLRSSTKKIFLI